MLFLQVVTGADGTLRKSWLYRYFSPETRKEHSMGLGPFDRVSLSRARAARDEARAWLSDHIDPIAERDRRRNAEFQESQADEADVVSPVFGETSVAAIDTNMVVAALKRDDLWTNKPETAGRVRGRIESILDWATAFEFRKGDNPARWKGHLDQVLPPQAKVRKVKHQSAMDYVEVPAFMAKSAVRTHERRR
jgi:hypothetical protein